jgi:WS/DGAT/MGAT family acyltransferase
MMTATESAPARVRRDRLSPQDATFVYAETGAAPLSVGMLGIIDRPADGRAATVEALRAHLAGRLQRFPRLRQKLAFVPFEQGHPVWTDDDRFDLAAHVASETLPGERDLVEAQKFMARFMAAPLSRSRPLWQMRLLPLADGRFAVAFKIHHCLLDGVGAAHLVTVLFDMSPTAPPAPTGDRWRPAPTPTPRQLLREAIRDQRDRTLALARRLGSWRLTRDSLEQLVDRAGEVAANLTEQARAMLVPRRRTALTGGVGPYRRFEPIQLPLDQLPLDRIRAIKSAAGTTVNDVVLTLVAGGVGELLRERGVDTRGATVKAAVPVSRRAAGAAGALGNQVSMMTVDLPVDGAPADNLLARIARDMRVRKQSGQAEGADFWMSLADYAPASLIHVISRIAAGQHLIDLVVTNVPGPQFPLYLLGGKMTEVYPFVPLFGGTSLAAAVVSYDGRLYIGLTGDHDAVSDLRTVASGLTETFETLHRRSEGENHVEFDHRCGLPSRHGTVQEQRQAQGRAAR